MGDMPAASTFTVPLAGYDMIRARYARAWRKIKNMAMHKLQNIEVIARHAPVFEIDRKRVLVIKRQDRTGQDRAGQA